MAKNGGSKRSVIVKKSPVVIVKNFILLQIIAVVLYVGAGSLAYYAQIYRSLPINHIISYQIAQALFIFGVEFFLIFFIFFRWYKEYFHIQPDQIIHSQGIIFRSKLSIPIHDFTTVAYRQGPLGKLVKYGTIELRNESKNHAVYLKEIPEPQDYVDLILKFKRMATLHKKPVSLVNGRADIATLMGSEENEGLEFKSTFRWDIRGERPSRNIEKSAMKTIAAFLNSHGGYLLMGVDDKRNVLGLEPDFATLGRADGDAFEIHFSHVFHTMIGSEFRQYVKLSYHQLDGKTCCLVTVTPSSKPVYLKMDDDEEFYIRTGNGTTSLKLSEAAAYIDSRFKSAEFI